MSISEVQQMDSTLHKDDGRLGRAKQSESRIFLVEQRTLGPPDDYLKPTRHSKSTSMHYNSDGLSLRRNTNIRAKSADPAARQVASNSSSAALKAAQLSANAHYKIEHRTSQTRASLSPMPPPKAPKVLPKASHLAAASKAWSNSTIKPQQHDKIVETPIIVSSPAPGLLQPLPINSDSSPIRKSTESIRPPLQSEFLLPTRSGGRAPSVLMVQEVNNYVNAEQTHNGPLQAARISFAQDREAHGHESSPPSRPPSTRPGTIYTDDEQPSRSLISLPLWNHDRYDTPPPTARNAESSKAALTAASMTWASHEHDNPRPTTPAIEPYQYMTHNSHTTLRHPHKEDVGKFWKHGRVQPMSATDRKRYDGLWAANKGLLLEHAPAFKDEVASVVVRDIWQRSRLQVEILRDIYDLVDRTQTGRLSRDEFVVGTWLVDHSLRGRRLPFKRDLTDDLFSGNTMARLGIRTPKKLKHDEKKALKEEKKKEKSEKSKNKKKK